MQPAPHPIARRCLWTALACSLAAFVLGARWAVINQFGMDLPEWDQWDAEGLHLLLPWFQGRPLLPALFAPHNEHYVVLTKLTNLALTLANGVWDQRVESVFNALLPTSIAVAFLAWSRRFVPDAAAGIVALFLAAAWGLPVAWHNVVSGFHSQQFYLIGLSFASIALLASSRPVTFAWWLGALASLLALLSMASGFFAAASVIAVLGLQWGLRETAFRNVWPTLLLAVGVCAIGWLTRREVDYHATLKARSLADFLMTVARGLQWPARGPAVLGVIVWVPWLWLTARLLFHRADSPLRVHGWILWGLGTWVWLQLIATGYARGAGGPTPAVRYLDTLVFGCAVNLLAALWLWTEARGAVRRRILTAVTALAWLGIVVHGLGSEAASALANDLPRLERTHRKAIEHTRAYLGTGDASLLDHPDSPYPDVKGFAERLAHPELRRLLPDTVQPAHAAVRASGAGWLSSIASKSAALGEPIAAAGLIALLVLGTFQWAIAPRAAVSFQPQVPRWVQTCQRWTPSRPVTALLVISAVGMAFGFSPLSEYAPPPLAPWAAGSVPTIGESTWQPNGIFPSDAPPYMRRLAVRGSYVGGDDFIGEHVTGWYRTTPQFSLMVVGYPTRPGNQLIVEFRSPAGEITTHAFDQNDPTERWAEWKLTLPANADAVRVRAIDRASGFGGWLGFSEPFTRESSPTFSWRMTLQTFSAVGLAIALVLGPGLAWRRRYRSNLLSVLWVGPAGLALGGGICWLLGGIIAPAVTAVVWVVATLG